MKTVSAIIEKGKDKEFGYSIYMDCYSLPYGITGTGDTVEEAKDDFISAYQEIKTLFNESGKKYTEVEFVFKYDVASFLSYYAYAFSLAGLSRITGINQGQLSHYINGTSKPAQKTIDNIQEKVNNFGIEMSKVKFASRSQLHR